MSLRIDVSGAVDMHHHLRDVSSLDFLVEPVMNQFTHCIVMPNLTPPVTDTEKAKRYYSEITSAQERIGKEKGISRRFIPLMTLYLTKATTPETIKAAHASGIVRAVKLYPAGATTHSDAGVRLSELSSLSDVFQAMSECGMPLCIHGEVTDPQVDIFDRERVFVEEYLKDFVKKFPDLRIILEHVTTKEAVEFVRTSGENIAATITAQHLLFNRNRLFEKGLNPHFYCLPVLKLEEDRLAVLAAATGGSGKFFLGTDSAPHPMSRKHASCCSAGCFTSPIALQLYAEAFDSVGKIDQLHDFACVFGKRFYGIETSLNEEKTFLVKETVSIPAEWDFSDKEKCMPFKGGDSVQWKLIHE